MTLLTCLFSATFHRDLFQSRTLLLRRPRGLTERRQKRRVYTSEMHSVDVGASLSSEEESKHRRRLCTRSSDWPRRDLGKYADVHNNMNHMYRRIHYSFTQNNLLLMFTGGKVGQRSAEFTFQEIESTQIRRASVLVAILAVQFTPRNSSVQINKRVCSRAIHLQ